MLQNKHEKSNLHSPHHGRDLQYAPARSNEGPTEYTGVGLADGLDGLVDQDGFFVSVGEIVCGHSGTEEGDDEEEDGRKVKSVPVQPAPPGTPPQSPPEPQK